MRRFADRQQLGRLLNGGFWLASGGKLPSGLPPSDGKTRPLPDVRSPARQWPILSKPAISVPVSGLAAVRSR